MSNLNPTYTSAEQRYLSDPVFHQLVHLFYSQMEQSNELGRLYTPTELREACIFAASMWEARHIRRIMLRQSESDKPMESPKD